MSNNLYLLPVVPQQRIQIGDITTRHVLCMAFVANDGSLRSEFILNTSHISILKMLKRVHDNDAYTGFRQDVDTIIGYIHQYGEVEMTTDE